MYRGSYILELPFGYLLRSNQKHDHYTEKAVNVNIQNSEQCLIIQSSGKKEYNIFDRILQEQNTYFIEVNSIHHGFDRLILQTHLRFYCQSKSYTNVESIQKIRGKCYKIKYDKYQNPQFQITEGIFQINISKEEYLLDGEGREYLGKSKVIRDEGFFNFGVLKKKDDGEKQVLQENKQKSAEKGFRIKILDQNNQILKIESCQKDVRKDQIEKRVSIKYNQVISERDEQILASMSTEWLNSSIIDAFVEYLNIKGEQIFNKLSNIERRGVDRILFIPSYVTTSFGVCDDEIKYFDKVEQQLKLELLFYEELDYDISQVYSKVGFPINVNNQHWVFLLIDLREEMICLYDSLQSTKKQRLLPNMIIKAIAKFLNLNTRECYKLNYKKQRDVFSCGYYVSSFMEYQYKLQFNKYNCYNYEQMKMRRKLRNLLKIV